MGIKLEKGIIKNTGTRSKVYLEKFNVLLTAKPEDSWFEPGAKKAQLASSLSSWKAKDPEVRKDFRFEYEERTEKAEHHPDGIKGVRVWVYPPETD